jgi:hypothetical protein
MKNIIFIILLFITTVVKSQLCSTLVVYDRIETYTWFGSWWIPSTTSGYYTNASTSPTTSAVIYGLGSGTSTNEVDWYTLPNIVGLNPSYSYQFKFRLGSYRFTSTNSTRGVDVGDFIEVQISTDGGVTYVPEIRVTGNNNAYWNYNTTGIITKTSNGVLTTYTPSGGGDRSTTGDGYSIITLNLPPNTTQISVDVYSRVNSAGEEWWFDDFELIEIFPCVPLPIELITFDVKNFDTYNHLTWVTLTEFNNDFFTLERSLDAMNWLTISLMDGSGTVSTPTYYEYKDYEFNEDNINYYRLKQTDFDGTSEIFKIVSIVPKKTKKKILIKRIGIDGREVDENYRGILIEIYSDGTFNKIFKE